MAQAVERDYALTEDFFCPILIDLPPTYLSQIG